jgi:hypothetical protein
VWKPVKPADAPKTDEERIEKIKAIHADLVKAEEKHPAVRTVDIEKQIEAASRKKSEQLDSQMTKAMGAGAPGAPGAPAAGMAPGVPGALLPGAGPAPPAGTPGPK